MEVDTQGQLCVGRCDSVDLAKQYGTPLHVIDETVLQAAFRRFHDAFSRHEISFQVAYSFKTNPVPAVLDVLRVAGAGAEVISPFELWLALEMGFEPDAIIYNGPGKTREGIELALRGNIRRININSMPEIDLIESVAAETGVRPTVGVRLFTGLGWGAQFGLGIESGEAWRAFERLSKSERLIVDGVHFHLGSQIRSTDVYTAAVETTLAFLSKVRQELGIQIQTLDVGGGYAVPTVYVFGRAEQRIQRYLHGPYAPPPEQGAPSAETFADAIVGAVQEACGKWGLQLPALVLEPGRILSSGAEVLLARVNEIRSRADAPDIAVLDAGINMAPMVQWEYHGILAASRMNEKHNHLYALAGPICTPGDLLSSCVRLPELAVGDLIAIMDAGAYFTAFENNFSFPKPAITLAREGRHRLVRTREGFEDLVQRDLFGNRQDPGAPPGPNVTKSSEG